MAQSTEVTLVPGQQYDWRKLKFVGWADGDGTGHEGYNVVYYFLSDGTYLGPDQHGIEPVFEAER